MKKPVLIITPGDPEGIGPEITWKAICALWNEKRDFSCLCVGARAPFEKTGAPIITFNCNLESGEEELPKETAPYIWLWEAPEHPDSPHLHMEGFQSGWAIQKAAELVLSGFASALVTGPISKDRLQKGGFPYSGHTEFLAYLCQSPDVTMMLANSALRISLVTTHLSLSNVSKHLSRKKIRRAVIQTAEGLRNLWDIEIPRIAIAALNPHAGENGLFGNEETNLIEPEINSLKEDLGGKVEISGPFPADTLFAKHILTPPVNRFDAIVCMYHDQGLIPVKLLDFHNTVNVTLGLPMIRTSVDHGVAFDIAGKGIANPSSLLAAIKLAALFVQKNK